jgi:glycerol-3-phosphate dehydrogenase
MTSKTVMDRDYRQTLLNRLRRKPRVTVLIAGGGINGAGLFRELALQGVDVLLVDRSDFCMGASCASSRMIHGGLRYLEFGEFRLVRESLKERNLLLKNAPHYVLPLPTTIPVLSWTSGVAACLGNFLGLNLARPARRGAAMVKAGLTLYDVFTWKSRKMPRHRFTGRRKALKRRPALSPNLICTATYYDAWISYPERLCLELLQDGSALSDSAVALNYMSLQSGGDTGVLLKDELTGEMLTVQPDMVVNATGAWIDFANRNLGLSSRMIGGTKGAHLILENEDLMRTLDGEMLYFENSDGRVAVALPWLGKVLVGSTDIRIDNPDEARCEEEEIDYILGALSELLPAVQVDRSQVVSYFSGVRPLPYSDASATVQISRDHHCEVTEPEGGIAFPVYSMIGGKWTTFRGFSEQVADLLLARMGKKRRSGSEDLKIGGGRGFPSSTIERERWIQEFEKQTGLGKERLAVLLERYGARGKEAAAYIVEAPDERLEHHEGYSRREIEYILLHEHVERLDDLVARRTAMALLGELTLAFLQELAGIMGAMRGWPENRIMEEVHQTAALLRERNGICLQ